MQKVSEHTLEYRKGAYTMSDREKLIYYIKNLTNEEAEAFIAFLKTAPSFEAVSKPLPQNNSQPEQKAAV